MGTYYFLLVVIVVFCFLLVMLILSQNPKGGGLSGTFGGGGSQMFGVQRTNDFLDKSTWTLAACITILIILSVIFVPRTQDQILPESDGSSAPAQEQTTPAAQPGDNPQLPEPGAPVTE